MPGENEKKRELGPEHNEIVATCLRIARELRGGVAEGRIALELRGHRLDLSAVIFMVAAPAPSLEVLREVASALSGGRPLDRFITLTEGGEGWCSVCTDRVCLETDGQTLRASKPCEYPNGIFLEFELNVPSGVLVVANDLREHFPLPEDFELGLINTRFGCMKLTLLMAQAGCAYAFVGNCDPDVVRVGEDRYQVVSSGYDQEHEREIKPEGERVASIMTVVWWYSMVDGGEYERRGCGSIHDSRVTKVPVKPGVYRFTHHRHEENFDANDWSRVRVLTDIEWVRPADSVDGSSGPTGV